MNFLNWNDNTFTEKELEILTSWDTRMTRNPIGKCIVENMEKDMIKEPGVSEYIRKRFFKNLVKRLNAGDTDLTAVKNSIDKDMLLKGPRVPNKELSDSPSKLIKVRTLFKYLKDNLTIFRGRESYKQVNKWIEEKKLSVDKHFKRVKFFGRQSLFWTAFTHDLDSQRDLSDINEICNGIGYSDFNEGDYIIELFYDKNGIKNPRIPTTIEAGTEPFFCPCEKETGHVFAFDLTCGVPSEIPEIVHEPINIEDVQSINCKVLKVNDAVSYNESFTAEDVKLYDCYCIDTAVINLERKNTTQLMHFVEKRLRNIDVIPPLCKRSEEPPEYFLEKIYERSQNEQFKSRFRCVITRLLTKEEKEVSESDYLATLLILCEQYSISEAVVPVAGMVLSEQLKGEQSVYGDLHHRSLMALARMSKCFRLTELWVNAIYDERYTAAAFAALREQGREKLAPYFPMFEKMHQMNRESIDMDIARFTIDEPQMEDKTVIEYNCCKRSRFFMLNMEFTTLFVEAKKIERANQLLIRSAQLPLDLNWVAGLIPSKLRNVEWYALKSKLCLKLLSIVKVDTKPVAPEIKAWKLIALMEENFERQVRWSELQLHIEQGKFKACRY